MFLPSTSSGSRRISRVVRAISYLVAALAGAAGVTLLRRAAGSLPQRLPIHVPRRWDRSPLSNLRDAGWAELLDEYGTVVGRGQVMLALGTAGEGRKVSGGEVRSFRFTPGASVPTPGHYRLRFETGLSSHHVEVTAFPAGDADIASIRWIDGDLPTSMIELGGN